MIQSDQVTMTDVLLSDWPKCQSRRQDNSSDCKMEWGEEEYSDWPDEEVSVMHPENKELWKSFLNSASYNPLYFTCLPEVMALDIDHAAADGEESVPPCSREWKGNVERGEDEDSDWSDEGDSDDEEMSRENKELWESFFNKHYPYNPLHSNCPTEVNIKSSEVQQNHIPLRPTASEVTFSDESDHTHP
ncbi:hypothetical protein Baya_6789 [Bagarius yarrelli]|uniref:Protein phosphatase 1 regulatory subunit 15A/B C-terminal domain-containing protein n=1 Tax=Bagarius yarrelli TaxID=175774 RepID=A0A556TYU5_BAGYA|nr:hypothetical protein Baya_6789 [Bagarius yarrelli]